MRKLAIPIETAMSCKMKFSNHRETCRLEDNRESKCACVVEANESTKCVCKKLYLNIMKTTLLGKGVVEYNLVHKFIPVP